MITRDEPYSEYQDDFDKITSVASQGILPLGLMRIENALCIDFIQKCICVDPTERLSVEQLLEHPFLQPNEVNDEKEVSIRKLSFYIYLFVYLLTYLLTSVVIVVVYKHKSYRYISLVPLPSKLPEHRNHVEKLLETTPLIEKTKSSDTSTKDQSTTTTTISISMPTATINNTLSFPPPLPPSSLSLQTEFKNSLAGEQVQSMEPSIKPVNKDSDPSNPLFSSVSPADRPPRHPSPAITQSHSEDGAISRTTPYLFPRDPTPNDINTPQIESLGSSSSTPPIQQQIRASDAIHSEKSINNNISSNFSNNFNSNSSNKTDINNNNSNNNNSINNNINDNKNHTSSNKTDVSVVFYFVLMFQYIF